MTPYLCSTRRQTYEATRVFFFVTQGVAPHAGFSIPSFIPSWQPKVFRAFSEVYLAWDGADTDYPGGKSISPSRIRPSLLHRLAVASY